MHADSRGLAARMIVALTLWLVSDISVLLAQTPVLTQHNDSGRTGQNLNETVLNTSNVNVNQFGKLFSMTVDGQIYAQPLYVSQVTISGAVHNVVYVATENDSVYAFDADNGVLLWHASTGTPVPSTAICCNYLNMTPSIGITATPVIDLGSNTMYVVAKSEDTTNGTFHQKLHALDIATGAEKFGAPVEITASVAGSGGSSINGIINFDPLHQLNRPGLLLLNGIVYLGFGSTGDKPDWHGWVLGYNATTLQQVAVYNDTPNGDQAGIWEGGQGLVADSASNIYVMTGNGTFDVNTGGSDYGDSVLKLGTSSGLVVLDYFTPDTQNTLNSLDLDLGGGGLMLIPGTSLVVGGGKDGILRLISTNNMGKFNMTSNNDVQEFQATSGHIMGGPVYWNSPNNGPVIYLWGPGDYLKAFAFANGALQTSPVSKSTMTIPAGNSNASPMSVSANGSQAGTGIIWAPGSYSGDADSQIVPGILRALDASNVSTELWNSKQNARDDLGNYAKFCPPTIANGKVYLATFSNQLVVYGLLSAIPPPTRLAFGQQPTNTQASSSISPAVTVKVEDANNNVVQSSTASVALTVGTNPGGGMLSGTTTMSAVNGVATFSDLSIRNTGMGYTLVATSATLTQATSSTFNITPRVSSVSPGSGTRNGGTAVTIAGAGFISGATVTFGGNSATKVGVISTTSITATTPAHAVGPVNVVVTNPDGTSGTLTNGFNYKGKHN